jgi:DnaK suppressor protein
VVRQRGTSKPGKKTAAKKTAGKKTAVGKAVREKAAGKAAAGKKTALKTVAKARRKTAAAKARKKPVTGGKKTAGTLKRAGKMEKTGTAAKKVVKVRKKLSKAAKERIDKLRTMLEQRRTEILASIRKAREDTVEAHRQTFAEVGDLVSASLEKEMAFKYGEYGVNMLREIDTALEKLKEGSYGICEDCGRMIGVKRLEIVPSARLCIKCKSKEEEGTKGNR